MRIVTPLLPKAILVSLMLWTRVAAGECAPDIDRIVAAQKSVESMTAEFTQVKTLKLFEESIRSKGKILIAKPDFYLWIYSEPEKRIFFVDGMNTGTFEPGSRDREEVSLDNRPGLAAVIHSVTAVLTGNVEKDVDEDYEVSLAGSARSSCTYILRPKTEELESLLQQVSITFNRDSSLANELEIVEPNGDVTSLKFDRWKINIPVDKDLFLRDRP